MNKVEVLKKLMELGEAFTVREAKEKLGIGDKIQIYTVTPNPGQPPVVDNFLLASLVVKPSDHSLLERPQLLRTHGADSADNVHPDPQKERIPGRISIGGQRFRVVTVRPHKFFGLSTIRIGGRNVDITDSEKTLIDCLDKPQYCGGISEVMKALRNSVFGRKTLLEYAERMRNRAILKRLGFLSERLGLGLEGENKNTRKEPQKLFSAGPNHTPEGPF
ncbi:hypothetical protein [Thermococcus sp. M39]|uniref:type IV toxin-antitoxin system AbiEi family antitoxin domain-containing protein n=1 Tax=Thermococcus sp. M39 TaxID=1638262 RepID=UPI001F0EE22F|nr:hypothetical protein [Thermococcus sp. M39]